MNWELLFWILVGIVSLVSIIAIVVYVISEIKKQKKKEKQEAIETLQYMIGEVDYSLSWQERYFPESHQKG